jgi:hypothetical protein
MIRRFATNASEMKKLAARDFEDLLQVRSRICGEKKKLTYAFASVQYTSIRRTAARTV